MNSEKRNKILAVSVLLFAVVGIGIYFVGPYGPSIDGDWRILVYPEDGSDISEDLVVGLYVYTDDNVLPNTGSTLSLLYSQNKDNDGFLYLKLAKQSTFG